MVRDYIDDVLVITKNKFEDHLKSLDRFLQRLAEAVLKVNAENSYLGQIETQYLGFWLINNRVRPLSSKVEAIKPIDVTNKVRDARKFV